MSTCMQSLGDQKLCLWVMTDIASLCCCSAHHGMPLGACINNRKPFPAKPLETHTEIPTTSNPARAEPLVK